MMVCLIAIPICLSDWEHNSGNMVEINSGLGEQNCESEWIVKDGTYTDAWAWFGFEGFYGGSALKNFRGWTIYQEAWYVNGSECIDPRAVANTKCTITYTIKEMDGDETVQTAGYRIKYDWYAVLHFPLNRCEQFRMYWRNATMESFQWYPFTDEITTRWNEAFQRWLPTHGMNLEYYLDHDTGDIYLYPVKCDIAVHDDVLTRTPIKSGLEWRSPFWMMTMNMANDLELETYVEFELQELQWSDEVPAKLHYYPSWMYESMMGDCKHYDYLVNMRDVGAISRANGQQFTGDVHSKEYCEWTYWKLDLATDGIINTKDLGIACRRFGMYLE